MQEWLKRALRTFLQAALGCIAAGLTSAFTNGFSFTDSDAVKSTVFGIIATAVAAGLAAVMNMAKKDGVIGDYDVQNDTEYLESYTSEEEYDDEIEG